ncbi:TetR/AcrR family transcriptional regulator [Kribbella qitaiheensis]|uniref:TetR/AcrR family transcriptional regulator n=1 Tax=Kribbella qitaiheensis TaxID=1544730 RepID=UPI0036117448
MDSTSGTRARERLLAAADELFYSEGVQTVGVDRIAKRARTSKKSLYLVFGSKEALVLAYLEARRTSIEVSIAQGLARFDTPRERLLGVSDVQGDFFAAPDYNGCPFLAASAEAARGSLVERAHADYRAWARALLTELAAEADVPDHEAAGRELHLLYDAAGVAARADRDPSVAAVARHAAAAVLAHRNARCGRKPSDSDPHQGH